MSDLPTPAPLSSLARLGLTLLVFAAVLVVGNLLMLIVFDAGILAGLLSWLAATAAAIMVWREPQRLTGARGGRLALYVLSFGGVGFCAGFFGPMIFAPEANQGPLLGIFITGPGGALLGLLYGLFATRAD